MPNTTTLPPPLTESYDWHTAAKCRSAAYGQLWFSPDGEHGYYRHKRELQAKAVCMTCPVQTACREHALTVGEPYGVWGGLTESERRRST